MSKAPSKSADDELRDLRMPVDEFDAAMRRALQVPPAPDEKPAARPARKRTPKAKKAKR